MFVWELGTNVSLGRICAAGVHSRDVYSDVCGEEASRRRPRASFNEIVRLTRLVKLHMQHRHGQFDQRICKLQGY